MSFKDINGLVQQNVQLRNQVHMLSADLDKKDMELRVNDQYGCFFFLIAKVSVCHLSIASYILDFNCMIRHVT